jgi:hypothetical protein
MAMIPGYKTTATLRQGSKGEAVSNYNTGCILKRMVFLEVVQKRLSKSFKNLRN